ncbi:putative ribonuclease H-like domain-containing protein [Tanacetum coccineum]
MMSGKNYFVVALFDVTSVKAEGSETLEQTYNRLQAIVSHLEFMDVPIEKDYLNQKFLTSLAPEWLMYTIVWRNRDDLDTMSLDDLYNHLKVYEPEVQKKAGSNSQNMAFISSSNTSSGKGEVPTASVPTACRSSSTVALRSIEDENHALWQMMYVPTEFAIYGHLVIKSAKDKTGVGFNEYTVVPPPAQVYSPPKKDLSWTGLPEFVDDTITDCTRPTPSVDVLKDVRSDLDAHSNVKRPFERKTAAKNQIWVPKVPTGRTKIPTVGSNVPTAKPTGVVMIGKTKGKSVRPQLVDLRTLGKYFRGLPSKSFENDHTCVACLKGKQHKASCKTKLVNSVSKPLHTLHMDLFGPTSVSSLNHKWYCLVVTDDFSRFTWTFFLKSKDETGSILRNLITEIENLKDLKVKIIRCDNVVSLGIEKWMNSALRKVQKKMLIKAVKGLMVSISRLLFCHYWFHDAFIWNLHDSVRNSEANDVLKRSRCESPELPPSPIVETAVPTVSTPIPTGNVMGDFFGDTTNSTSLTEVEADISNMETDIQVSPTPTLRINKDHLKSQIIGPIDTPVQTRHKAKNVEEQSFIATIHQKTNPDLLQYCLFSCFLSQEEPKKIVDALKDESWVEAMQEELLQFQIQNVWVLVDCPKGEEGIDYEEVFAPVARIEVYVMQPLALIFDHLASNCGIWVAKGETWPRGNYSQNNKSMTPRAVLLKSGSKPFVVNKPKMNVAQPTMTFFKTAHVKRPFERKTAAKNKIWVPKVPTGRTKIPTVGSNVPTAKPTGAVDLGNKGKVVKASARYIWKPKENTSGQGSNFNSVLVNFKKYQYIDTQGRLKSVMAWVPKEN